MRRIVVFVALLATACSPPRSGSLGPGPSAVPLPPSPTVSASPAPAPSETPTASDGRTLTIQVWFHRDGKLFAAARTRPVTQNTSHLTLTELIAGPSTVEIGAGVDSAVPATTRFEIKGISADGTEVVSLPASFFNGEGWSLRMRQAQIVYSLTQFRSVKRVAFLSDGEPTGEPFGRADLEDLLPPIVVYSPVIGQRVTSPVTVSGIADVYESTVSIRILNKDGKEIAAKFTTASCNNSCHGGYSVAVSYRNCVNGPGTVQVYESSPADGTRLNVVAIPVQFADCSS